MTDMAPHHQAAAVQHPLWRGRHPVQALWFPAGWFDGTERLRRMLAEWRPGARALRYPQGDLLVHADARELDCGALAGWPLCRAGRCLSTAPVAPGEAAGLPVADAWIVEGGQATALDFADGSPIDLARWIAIDGLALHDTYDCRDVLAEPALLLPPEARDLREVLNGHVPPPSLEQLEFLRAMGEKKAGAPSARRGGITAPGSSSGREAGGARPSSGAWVVASAVLAGLGIAALAVDAGGQAVGLLLVWAMVIGAIVLPAKKAMGMLRRLPASWGGMGRGASGGTRRQPGDNTVEGAAPGRGLPSRNSPPGPQAWRRWLARLAVTSQISKLLGRRQAAYMRHMLELFESGQLEEALRHAIPLGDDDTPSLGQAFGTPGRRADLSLSQGPRHASSIHFGNDLDSHLRKLYRQSFEKLDRQGRIDEAVFVLAELLGSKQEALDYLEKHQRYKQAAELALAWDRPPDVIVRLHCLAGDWRAAAAVARRDGAFANAVAQLEPKWPDAAARLREEWASALAAQGLWLEAVEAIWPVKACRGMAAQWLLSAEAAGGGLSAAALVKRAILMPDTLGDCAPRLQAFRDDPACHWERAAMAHALLALKEKAAEARRLARIISPGLLADQGAGRVALSPADLTRLTGLADDRMIEADLPAPALMRQPPKALSAQTGMLRAQLPGAGSLAALDAVPLGEGRHLVALGEAGAVTVDAHGKVQARFSAPAERIVIAHSRQVALLLARRESVWRVSRLDLSNRRISDLGIAELAHFAQEFDGIGWTVARGSTLRVLDTQKSLSEVLWQVADLPGMVAGLSSSRQEEQIAISGEGGELELWRYRLPQRRLVNRGEPLRNAPAQGGLRLFDPTGGAMFVWAAADPQNGVSVHFNPQGRARSCTLPAEAAGAALLQAWVSPPWLVVGLADADSLHCQLIHMDSGRLHASLPWPIEAQPRARLLDGQVVIFDRQGRMVSIDTASSALACVSLR